MSKLVGDRFCRTRFERLVRCKTLLENFVFSAFFGLDRVGHTCEHQYLMNEYIKRIWLEVVLYKQTRDNTNVIIVL